MKFHSLIIVALSCLRRPTDARVTRDTMRGLTDLTDECRGRITDGEVEGMIAAFRAGSQHAIDGGGLQQAVMLSVEHGDERNEVENVGSNRVSPSLTVPLAGNNGRNQL